MRPNHIRNEVVRRLMKQGQLNQAQIKAVGIDPDALPIETELPLDPGPRYIDPPSEGEVLHGAVPFEMTISAFGCTETFDCRARFAATLHDDEDRRTGQPLRVLARCNLAVELLDWSDADGGTAAVPRWMPIQLWPLLSDEMDSRMEELVEASAVELEAAQPR
jgi:hypothetical protein